MQKPCFWKAEIELLNLILLFINCCSRIIKHRKNILVCYSILHWNLNYNTKIRLVSVIKPRYCHWTYQTRSPGPTESGYHAWYISPVNTIIWRYMARSTLTFYSKNSNPLELLLSTNSNFVLHFELNISNERREEIWKASVLLCRIRSSDEMHFPKKDVQVNLCE